MDADGRQQMDNTTEEHPETLSDISRHTCVIPDRSWALSFIPGGCFTPLLYRGFSAARTWY